MPLISLTDLVDIVSSGGTPKVTRVKQIKNRPEYNPAFDFYKKIRERIIETHRNSYTKNRLSFDFEELRDKKKITAYPQIVDGYKKWWGHKTISWFEPPSDLFSANGVDVKVNPELGVYVNNEPHLIKLYFKSERLSKNRIDIITHLMEAVLCSESPKNTTMSVLDIRRAKLFSPTVPIIDFSAMIKAEMAYISSLWPEL